MTLNNASDSLSKILPLLKYNLLGNSLSSWIVALVFFVFVYSTLIVAKKLIGRKIAEYSKLISEDIGALFFSILETTSSLLLFIVSIYVASLAISVPSEVERVLRLAFTFGLLFQGGIWASVSVTQFIENYVRRKHGGDPSVISALELLRFASKAIIWGAVLLLFLDNIGVNITALVTGLGIGGIAIALAVQNILGDLFSSLSIVLDRPFAVGDFIVVGDLRGTVEKIGLKTTRLRSIDGDQLIFSNSDLLNSRIRNYKRMNERRILFIFGVTYQTSHDKLKEISKIVEQIISNQENVRFDRCHFKEFGASALNFEVVYFVKSQDYNIYMKAQQNINLEILAQFTKMEIGFAYPTQTLFVESSKISENL